MFGNLNNTYEWSQILIAACVILGFFGTVLGLIGRLMWRHLKHEVMELRREITPNGGNTNSLGDVAVQIKSLLEDHLEAERRAREEAGRALAAGQKELLDAVMPRVRREDIK